MPNDCVTGAAEKNLKKIKKNWSYVAAERSTYLAFKKCVAKDWIAIQQAKLGFLIRSTLKWTA